MLRLMWVVNHWRCGLSGAEQVLQRELMKADKAASRLSCRIYIEILEGGAVVEQVGIGLTGVQGGSAQLGHP